MRAIELTNAFVDHVLFIEERNPAEADDRLAVTLADLTIQAAGNWRPATQPASQGGRQPGKRAGRKPGFSYWTEFLHEAESPVAATIGSGAD
jgi:hypothetical protein